MRRSGSRGLSIDWPPWCRTMMGSAGSKASRHRCWAAICSSAGCRHAACDTVTASTLLRSRLTANLLGNPGCFFQLLGAPGRAATSCLANTFNVFGPDTVGVVSEVASDERQDVRHLLVRQMQVR